MNYLFKNTTERDRDNAHARLCATLKVDGRKKEKSKKVGINKGKEKGILNIIL